MKSLIAALVLAGVAFPVFAGDNKEGDNNKNGSCTLVDPKVPSSCPGAIVSSKIFPTQLPPNPSPAVIAAMEFTHHGDYAFTGFPSPANAGFKKVYDETFLECHLRFGYWATVANTTVFTRIIADEGEEWAGDIDQTVPVAGTYQTGLSRVFGELSAGPHKITVEGATTGPGSGVWRFGNMQMDCREIWITPQE